MTIRIQCDANGCRQKDFQVFYCEDCYMRLEERLIEAEQSIKNLEEQLLSKDT